VGGATNSDFDIWTEVVGTAEGSSGQIRRVVELVR